MPRIDAVDYGLPDQMKKPVPEAKQGLSKYFVCIAAAPVEAGKTAQIAKLAAMSVRDQTIDTIYIVSPTADQPLWDMIPPSSIKDVWTDPNDLGGTVHFIDKVEHDERKRKQAWEEIQERFPTIEEFMEYVADLKQRINAGRIHDADALSLLDDVNRAGFDELEEPVYYKRPTSALLIIDDAMSSALMDWRRDNYLQGLTIRHRWCNLNIMIALQGLKGVVDKKIRGNATAWMIWRFGEKAVMKDLYEMVGGIMGMSEATFAYLYQLVTDSDDKDENYLIVDRRHPEFPVRAGWNIVARDADELIDHLEAERGYGISEDKQDDL